MASLSMDKFNKRVRIDRRFVSKKDALLGTPDSMCMRVGGEDAS